MEVLIDTKKDSNYYLVYFNEICITINKSKELAIVVNHFKNLSDVSQVIVK